MEPRPDGSRLVSFGPAHVRAAFGIHRPILGPRAQGDQSGFLRRASFPTEPLLSLKGIAVVLADGISTSDVSPVASESAVKSFLTDYYCTSESWSVKTSAHRVIAAANSWLHAQTRQKRDLYEPTGPGRRLCLHAERAGHQVGDGAHLPYRRCPHLSRGRAPARAADRGSPRHRFVRSELSGPRPGGKSAGRDRLPRPAGRDRRRFVLATDGVYEHVGARFIIDTIRQARDLDGAARRSSRRPPGAAARTT